MRTVALVAALFLAGCATSSYNLTVMPRDSGRLYSGVADDSGSGEGRISITIDDKTYSGTWVETAPAQTSAYMGGAYGGGYRGRGWVGMGGYVTMDNPQGGSTKALLTAPDGSGLRCDFSTSYSRGGGVCRDDRGREYDVQVRLAERK